MFVVARSGSQASANQNCQALLFGCVHNLWALKMLIHHGVVVVVILLLKYLCLIWMDRSEHFRCSENNAEKLISDSL